MAKAVTTSTRTIAVSDAFKRLAARNLSIVESAEVGVSSLISNVISIKNGRFALVENGERIDIDNPLKLLFITVEAKEPNSRAYYASAPDPKNASPPDCFSYDGRTPEKESANIQASDCSSCKLSEWGSAVSAISGASKQACRIHKDVVIKILGVSGFWLLKIPPASIKPKWGPLVKRIKDLTVQERAKDPNSSFGMSTCVIEATFEQERVGVLNFREVGYAPDEEVLEIVNTMDKDAFLVDRLLWGPKGAERRALATGVTSTPTTQKEIKPVKQAQIKPVESLPVSEVEFDDEKEIDVDNDPELAALLNAIKAD